MMNDTFMKEKPVLPLILSMTLPMVLSMLVNSLYNIVDSFFVAQISEEAMTALSLVYPVQNFINAAGIGFGVGINAVIAFYLGAGDHRKADQAATQGLVLAVIHGVVMTVCCITIMPVFLRMFTSSEAVIELGVRYSVIAFAFTLIIIVGVTFEKLFQAVGNMKTTMISLMCGCITNIVLDPVLIFGYGPFPGNGNRRRCAGDRHRTGSDADDLPCSLSCAANSRAYPQAVHSPQQKDGNKAVLHWHSRNPESRASVSFDFGAQCDFGGIFRSVYSGFGNLLQIADICLSSGEWHCAGDAPPDRL